MPALIAMYPVIIGTTPYLYYIHIVTMTMIIRIIWHGDAMWKRE